MKARFQSLWDRLFYKPEPLKPGIYQKTISNEGKPPFRVHLRIEKDGRGILVLNAKTVLHLNQTAAEYALLMIHESSNDVVAQAIEKRYRITRDEALSDYQKFVDQLEVLRTTPDLDPEIFLDIDRVEPGSEALSAPLRLDCALTYQTSSGLWDGIAPTRSVARNLDTEEWKSILQKAWDNGIPHVVFTGGEPTLRPDLLELVQFSQNLGQVTGLITDGMHLTEKEYLDNLLLAGLDHLMLVLDPGESTVWEALRDAMVEDLSVSIHFTLSARNMDKLSAILDHIAQYGQPQISLSANSTESRAYLPAAQRIVAEHGFTLVWGLPVPYSAANPIRLELEQAEQTVGGPGSLWLYVEPDGDVLRGQGIQPVLGNFLVDPFDEIWSAASRLEKQE
jgi:organic radical activating enzyme